MADTRDDIATMAEGQTQAHLEAQTEIRPGSSPGRGTTPRTRDKIGRELHKLKISLASEQRRAGNVTTGENADIRERSIRSMERRIAALQMEFDAAPSDHSLTAERQFGSHIRFPQFAPASGAALIPDLPECLDRRKVRT